MSRAIRGTGRASGRIVAWAAFSKAADDSCTASVGLAGCFQAQRAQAALPDRRVCGWLMLLGVKSGALQGGAVLPRRGTEGLAETVVEVAGAGKAAGQGHFSQWQGAVLQQLLAMAQALGQHITVRWQA